MSARALDHLVISVDGLDAARRRLGALGFTVAPQGVHPFGTVNACVYLADGTFIEPLAVGDGAAVKAAIAAQNSFVLGDARFREARGGEGLSGLVLTSRDADADNAEFARLGIAGGPMVAFSRPFMDGDGKADTASFLLAFAAPASGADGFFFVCERRKVPAVDRSALERHANGATRIVAVGAEAADPAAFAGFLAAMAGGAALDKGASVEVELHNAGISVVGNGAPARPRLTFITIGVGELAATRAVLQANGVAFIERRGRLHVAPEEGQGAEFVFEEKP